VEVTGEADGWIHGDDIEVVWESFIESKMRETKRQMMFLLAER
jgi:hypothetical protein